MELNFSELTPVARYFAMNQAVVPRPIAWVLTENDGGSYNLAPFSYFNAVSSDPAILFISVGKKAPGGESKDTWINLERSKRCVLHIPSVSHAELVTESSRTLPYGQSEVEDLKLELIAWDGFALPRLKDCSVAFGCKLHQIVEIGDAPQAMILLEIEVAHFADSVAELLENGRLKIHADKIDPLARLGGNEYANLGKIISVPRPK